MIGRSRGRFRDARDNGHHATNNGESIGHRKPKGVRSISLEHLPDELRRMPFTLNIHAPSCAARATIIANCTNLFQVHRRKHEDLPMVITGVSGNVATMRNPAPSILTATAGRGVGNRNPKSGSSLRAGCDRINSARREPE